MRVARITAFVVGAVAIFLAIKLQTINVAFLVGLAFAVAASANLPVIVLSIFWRRFNTAGAVAGLGVGLLASIVLIIISPSIMGVDAATDAKRAHPRRTAIFPLTNPGIISIPLGFLAAPSSGTLFSREPSAGREIHRTRRARRIRELGAETATEH